MGKCIVLGVLLCLFQAEQTGTIEGTVREQDGTVASGIQVALLNLTADGPILRETVTDEKGRYDFGGLVPGSYAVVHELGICVGAVHQARDELANCERLNEQDVALGRKHLQQWLKEIAPRYLSRYEVVADHSTRCDFELPTSKQVRLLLRHHLGSIPDAEVSLTPRDFPYYGWRPGEAAASAGRPDEDGVFVFPRLRLGRYIPLARIGLWKLGWASFEVNARAHLTRELELGRYSIRLRILDARGERVDSARPWIVGRAGTVAAVTDLVLGPSQDWFEVPYAAAGTYAAWAEAGNVRTRVVTGIEVGPDSPHPEATLHLPRAGSIRVKHMEDRSALQGAPPTGISPEPAVVSVHRRGDPLPVRKQVPINGEVLFEYLYEGTYLVESGERPSFLRREVDPIEVEVKAFETTEVTLVVPAR